MNGEDIFKAIISGQFDNPLGDALRSGLGLLSKGYQAGIRKRNQTYDAGRGVYHSSVPIISVGNITAGGTGKTPMVRYICDLLAQEGYQPTVVTRGYKAQNNKHSLMIAHQGHLLVEPSVSGDEAFLLAKALPESSVIIGRSRTESAQMVEAKGESNVIIMDDGFQHRALGRDADIVLIDASNPFGYGHVLPRGLLREPLEGLGRASALVLTKVDQVAPGVVGQVIKQLKVYAPNVPIAQTVHGPEALYTLEDWLHGCNPMAPDRAKDKKVIAASGIGNPRSFYMTLDSLGYSVVDLMSYPDHHDFTNDDLVNMWEHAFAKGAEAICITEKDAVKLSQLQAADDLKLPQWGKAESKKLPIYVLTIGIHFVDGERELKNHINSVVHSVV